jgi:drug/metabolite transporter (DMT)-like permease
MARHRLSILAAALCFSTGGAAIKACGLTGWQVASFRSGIAALALLLFIPAARQRWSWRTSVVALAYAATMICFVLANKLTTAANTIFLQSAAPLYILVLAPLVLKERIARSDLGLMAAIVAGMVLFFVDVGPGVASAPRPFAGNVLAALSGVTWAALLLGLRWLQRAEDAAAGSGLVAVVAGNLLAFALALPLALPVTVSTAVDWTVLGYLGVIQIGLAYVFLSYGFKHVPAFEASLLILLEPALNPVWAWIFQDEVPGGWALAGGVLILGATAAKTWLDQRALRRAVARRARAPAEPVTPGDR